MSRKPSLLLGLLVLLALATLGCSGRFNHVTSPAEATGTAGGTSVSTVSPSGTNSASAGLVRVPAPTWEQENEGCPGQGQRLCLVALGDFPPDLLAKWADHIARTYGITVNVMPPVDALDAWNPERQQVLAEGGISAVLDQYDEVITDHDVSLIIVTALDMNTHDVEPFIFGITESGREGIVSGYHMDPLNRGATADEQLYEQRMLKLVTKYVGITYYHLPTSSDMGSLMYGPINSIIILDALPPELPGKDPKKVF